MDINTEIQKIVDTSATPVDDLKALHGKLLKLTQTGSYPPGSAWAWMATIDGHIEQLQRRAKSSRRRKKSTP